MIRRHSSCTHSNFKVLIAHSFSFPSLILGLASGKTFDMFWIFPALPVVSPLVGRAQTEESGTWSLCLTNVLVLSIGPPAPPPDTGMFKICPRRTQPGPLWAERTSIRWFCHEEQLQRIASYCYRSFSYAHKELFGCCNHPSCPHWLDKDSFLTPFTVSLHGRYGREEWSRRLIILSVCKWSSYCIEIDLRMWTDPF